MSDIFQEVDEEVRRDKAAEFWKKYQNLILAGAVLVVLASAGFRYWQYERERAAQAAGDQFQQALAARDAAKLIKLTVNRGTTRNPRFVEISEGDPRELRYRTFAEERESRVEDHLRLSKLYTETAASEARRAGALSRPMKSAMRRPTLAASGAMRS